MRGLLRENWYRDVWLLVITGVTVSAILLTLSLADENHSSLCALRGDLERRVASGEQFLSENPNGTPGIPARFVRSTVDGQQRTISALRSLNCQ